jgi:hypothetical protein
MAKKTPEKSEKSIGFVCSNQKETDISQKRMLIGLLCTSICTETSVKTTKNSGKGREKTRK